MSSQALSLKAHQLKWIKPELANLSDSELKLVNHCLVTATDASNRIVGFLFLEPRAMDLIFFQKLEKRVMEAKVSGIRFSVFLPEFIKHRLPESLTSLPKNLFDVIISPWVRISSRASQVRVQHKIRVVCVDDSPLLLKVLSRSLANLGFVEVAAVVSEPAKAVEIIERMRPDIVTMDIQMPKMNGVQLVGALLERMDLPVIMVSSMTLEDGTLVFDALNAGAFDYVQKPSRDEFEHFEEELKEKFLSALDGQHRHSALGKVSRVSKTTRLDVADLSYADNLVWCLGASTGGTQALTQVLTRLPSHIPPTLIVQHIPPVFSKAFADSLNALCPFTVKEAVDGERVLKDHVYIAAGGKQMALKKIGPTLILETNDDPPVNRFKPSVDYMFSRVEKVHGLTLVAGVMTGMGRDGAQGLLALKNKGAKTFAQDEASSAVFGMPRAAIEAGAANEVLGIDQIADFLVRSSSKARRAS